MSGTTSFDVKFWDIKKRNDGRSRPWRVRWEVGGRESSEYFRTKALADGFRNKLLKAARAGEAFDVTTGLPVSEIRAKNSPPWFDFARGYVEHMWEHAATKTRRSMADALATVTAVLVTSDRGAPDAKVLRRALYGWAFNCSKRGTIPPDDIASALSWISSASVTVAAMSDPTVIRQALGACGRKQDGKPAAATTFRRKRAVLHHALGHAVEQQLLDTNPVEQVQWKAPEVAKTIDRRVAANPDQVRALLDAVSKQGKTGDRLTAFFGCIYYAGTRPSEALAITVDNLTLPEQGWGRLDLVNSEPRAGVDWTDDGKPRDKRGLKRRGQYETRPVPIPPELVALLRRHIDTYGTGEGGRLFCTLRGGPPQDSHYTALWRKARAAALTPAQAASPLARRPYDLRHAAVSLWLNAGVPATEVARRAGHSVDVLLRVYANCVDGQDQFVNDRIADALTGQQPAGEPGKPGQAGEATDTPGAGCEILDPHPAGTWRADSGDPDVA
ncbi:tyrosine-type recombinase/integrase [Candidatus Protofrankia californiensis]|uniref:tyrosine-type recombinase/integrase n=1 Tax=Candidatus Protofrankia californiensis TaxID=1839754 RepID=UPI00104172A1|nr:tyrosine-type recombinase/integrase [Candidatus Protofrankia californiensis]